MASLRSLLEKVCSRNICISDLLRPCGKLQGYCCYLATVAQKQVTVPHLPVQTPGCIQELVKQEQADILVLQETKLQDKATAGIQAKLGLPDWHIYWNCSQARKGYSGVALFSRYVCTAMSQS